MTKGEINIIYDLILKIRTAGIGYDNSYVLYLYVKSGKDPAKIKYLEYNECIEYWRLVNSIVNSDE